MTSAARTALRLLRDLNLCRRADDYRRRAAMEMNLDQFDAERDYLRPVDDPQVNADVDRYLSRRRRRANP